MRAQRHQLQRAHQRPVRSREAQGRDDGVEANAGPRVRPGRGRLHLHDQGAVQGWNGRRRDEVAQRHARRRGRRPGRRHLQRSVRRAAEGGQHGLGHGLVGPDVGSRVRPGSGDVRHISESPPGGGRGGRGKGEGVYGWASGEADEEGEGGRRRGDGGGDAGQVFGAGDGHMGSGAERGLQEEKGGGRDCQVLGRDVEDVMIMSCTIYSQLVEAACQILYLTCL